MRGVGVLGDVILDSYVFGKACRVSPEASVLVLDEERKEYRPGGAANVALQVRAMGCESYLVGVMPHQDPLNHGGELVQALQRAEVDVNGIVYDAERTLTTKTRFVDTSHGMLHQLLRVDNEQRDSMNGFYAGEVVQNVLDRRDWLWVMSDYGKGVVSEAVLQGLHQAGMQGMILDPKPQNWFLYSRFKDVFSVMTPNVQEAKVLAQTDNASPENLCKRLHKMFGVSVVLKMGEDGVALYDASTKVFDVFPAIRASLSDVVGAGDVLVGTLAVGLACQQSLTDAVRVANVAAGLSVQRFGASQVLKKELEEYISQRGA